VLDKLENIVAFLILLNSVPSFHSMTAFLYIKKKNYEFFLRGQFNWIEDGEWYNLVL